jgi:hypothetical protein
VTYAPPMRLLAVTTLIVGQLATAGCSTDPPRVVMPTPRPSTSNPVSTSTSPSPPPSRSELCARVRQTTRALGPGVARSFEQNGTSGEQLLEVVRAVYRYAETSLAGYRKQAADPALAAVIRTVELRYAEIRARLRQPADVHRVNYQPRELEIALAGLDRVCR